MLSNNIRNYRKKLNLSQDELAEKLGVSRQSVSFWETGQTQPTIDNIIALAKVFQISTDMLLGNSDGTEPTPDPLPENQPPKKKGNPGAIVAICIAAVVVIGIAVAVIINVAKKDPDEEPTPPPDPVENVEAADSEETVEATESTAVTETDEATESAAVTETDEATESTAVTETDEATESATVTETDEATDTTETEPVTFDLFSYCKALAIEKGTLRGDYCIYQQPATNYGGYENEYFSITYWADSNMVEFSLHCPLSDTLSHNFYLQMRGGYDGTYEYVSSKYYRDTGESLRYAKGTIDPALFYDGYPISCDVYEGSLDGQDTFMEDTRVGVCDLIRLIKEFVTVENLDCDFSDFDFVNF